MSSDNSPSVILSKQTFELRMTLLKVKQINPLLRLTKVLFVLLFKVITVSPLFKTKIFYTFTNKTTPKKHKTWSYSTMYSLLGYHQFQGRLSIWDSLGVWNSTVALSEHRAILSIKFFLFQLFNRWK